MFYIQPRKSCFFVVFFSSGVAFLRPQASFFPLLSRTLSQKMGERRGFSRRCFNSPLGLLSYEFSECNMSTSILPATINMPSIVPLKNIFIFTKIGAECERAARTSAKLCGVGVTRYSEGRGKKSLLVMPLAFVCFCSEL